MVDTVKVKLVTLIATSELQERLQGDLRELGASGYTIARVNGRGEHGPRTRGVFDVGNVQIETLVAPEVANKILERVAGYEELRVVAFACDVEAVPRSRFA
jgi:nitrogen regulatory protein PII